MKCGYNVPIFFEDCSNPITLKYVNNKVAKNYTIDSSKTLKYDGSLLKSANIFLEDIENTISFDVNIVTGNDEVHNVTIDIDIPLRNQTTSIYEGYFEQKNEKLNIKF